LVQGIRRVAKAKSEYVEATYDIISFSNVEGVFLGVMNELFDSIKAHGINNVNIIF
jgi:hypothetical protein